MLQIFRHRQLYKTTFMAILQQLIVGSSTVFIAKLSAQVSNHQPVTIWLALFIISLFAAYIPSSLSLYFAEKSKFLSLENYIARFEKTFHGKTTLRSNLKLKSDRSAYLSSEAYVIISQSIDFYLYFLGTSFSVLINVFLFGLVLSPLLMLAYIASIFLSIVGTKLGSHKIVEKTKDSQNEKVHLTSCLNYAWDNIVIGNSWNYLLWKNKFKSALNQTSKQQTNLVLSVEVLSGLTTLASLIPVIAAVVYLLIWQYDGTTAAILVATLPRQVQTIQNISTMVQMSFQWASIHSRLHCLQNSVTLNSCEKYGGSIDWKQLKIQKNNQVFPISTMEDLQPHLDLPGRITISGANGSGKSTLLSQLKENFQDRAIYLPPHSDLYFLSVQNENLSTGTKIVKAFDEIQKNIKNTVLLLDEWDANLDSERMNDLSLQIDKISENISVVEIRHRHIEALHE